MYKGKKKQTITSDEKKRIVAYCNRDIVPDTSYKINEQYPSEWFDDYFSYLGNQKLKKQLGNAYYQARFTYKLMSALNLTKGKHQGIVKFQIIQYASICEAILDYILENEYKAEIEEKYADTIYTKMNVLAKNTSLKCDGEEIYTCKVKMKKKEIRFIRIGDRTNFAVEKGIISQDTKDRICSLYDLRNTVHILKATRENYYPKLNEAKEAFMIMQEVVKETKAYCDSKTI